MLDEAVELYNTTPEDIDIIPSIQEVAEYVSAYNNAAEGDDPSALELAEAYLEEKEGVWAKDWKRTKKGWGKSIRKLTGRKTKMDVAEEKLAAAKKTGAKARKFAGKKLAAAKKTGAKAQKVAGKKVKTAKKYLGKKYKMAKKTGSKMMTKARKSIKGKGKLVGAAALGAAALGTAATLAYKKRKALGSGEKQAATAAIAAIKGQMSKCTTDKCKASAQKQIAKWQARM